MKELKVGDYVYKAYTPQRAGKVTKITEGMDKINREGRPYKTESMVEVKWVDGKRSIHGILILRCFKSLIEDHEKKLKSHKDMLSRLEKL